MRSQLSGRKLKSAKEDRLSTSELAIIQLLNFYRLAIASSDVIPYGYHLITQLSVTYSFRRIPDAVKR